MEAAGLVWIFSLPVTKAGPSNQWPSAKNAGQLPFLPSPLHWASEVIIATAPEAPREFPSQLLEKPFLVTAEGEGQNRSHHARQLGPLYPSILTHQSTDVH